VNYINLSAFVIPPAKDAAGGATQDQAAADAALPAGERLLKELDKANAVTLGSNDRAPQLFVIAMPGCQRSVCQTPPSGFFNR